MREISEVEAKILEMTKGMVVRDMSRDEIDEVLEIDDVTQSSNRMPKKVIIRIRKKVSEEEREVSRKAASLHRLQVRQA